MSSRKTAVLAYEVEPSNRRFRLRLARYRFQSEALSRALPPGPSRVLDAGCGRGRLPRYWRRWGAPDKQPEFTGFDLLPEKLQQAGDSGYARLLQQDIARPWPFPDGDFDAVVCEQVLEHLDDTALAFALGELRRVLRPGGVALIGTPVFKKLEAWLVPLWQPLNLWLHRLRGKKDPDHEQHLTLEQLRARVGEAGLQVEQARGFRIMTLPANWLEDYEWYYRLQQGLGARFPGACIEATLVVRRPA